MNSLNPPPDFEQQADKVGTRIGITIMACPVIAILTAIPGFLWYYGDLSPAIAVPLILIGCIVLGVAVMILLSFYEEHKSYGKPVPTVEQFSDFLLNTSTGEEYEVDLKYFSDSNKATNENRRRIYVPIHAALAREALKHPKPLTLDEALQIAKIAMEEPVREIGIKVMQPFVTHSGAPNSFQKHYNKILEDHDVKLTPKSKAARGGGNDTVL